MNEEDLFQLVGGRRGHFLYESGHHGELWLDLETLCRNPGALRPQITELAGNLEAYRPEVVCGPLVEGAFVGLLVAAELGCEFTYTLRSAHPESAGLFPVQYRLPAALRSAVGGHRVAIVNDVISAGSAVRGTYWDLRAHGANVLAVGALVVLGEDFNEFAEREKFAVETLARFPSRLWTAEDCPLCRVALPLERPAQH